MKMGDLFTRQADGIEFDIPDVNGNPTGEKITLLPASSDGGRVGRYVARQALPDLIAGKSMEDKARASDRAIAIAVSYLVSAWTLDDECTQKNAEEFLYNAPHLLDWADQVTSDSSNFFKKASAS